MDEAMREMELRPILEPLRALTSGEIWDRFLRAARPECLADDEKRFLIHVGEIYRSFLDAGALQDGAPATVPRSLLPDCMALIRGAAPGSTRPTWLDKASATMLDTGLRDQAGALPALWMWTLLQPMGDRVEEWMLAPIIRELAGRAGAEPAAVEDAPALVAFLLRRADWVARSGSAADLLADDAFQRAVHLNTFEGVSWLRKESLETLLPALFAAGMVESSLGEGMSRKEKRAAIARARGEIVRIREAAATSGYRWEAFREALA
jgi:hypothetical protein